MTAFEQTADPSRIATPAPSASVDPSSLAFRAVEGNATPKHSGETLLVEAYVVLWLLLMSWLFMLWRRQSSMNQRLDGLESALDRAAAKAAKAEKTASGK
jgi:CcmD family protein